MAVESRAPAIHNRRREAMGRVRSTANDQPERQPGRRAADARARQPASDKRQRRERHVHGRLHPAAVPGRASATRIGTTEVRDEVGQRRVVGIQPRGDRLMRRRRQRTARGRAHTAVRGVAERHLHPRMPHRVDDGAEHRGRRRRGSPDDERDAHCTAPPAVGRRRAIACSTARRPIATARPRTRTGCRSGGSVRGARTLERSPTRHAGGCRGRRGLRAPSAAAARRTASRGARRRR